ncbi:MAG: hypothetical protein Q8P24_06520, partial [Desulfobacterales bacterium]|nr:hypothetical protein [Desulfobacterales bacterium]
MKKLPLYLIFLWTFIHIGRPQDVFPALKLINPGDVVAILTLVSYIFVEKKNLRVFSFPEFRLLLLLFAVAVLSTPYGFYPKASLSFLYNFYFKIGLYLYLVAKLVTDEEQIQSMIKTVMLSGFLMAVAAVSSQQIGIRTGIGTTYDPNDLGMLFVVTLPLALFQGMTSTNRRWKIICYTGAVFNLLAVISTQSRGAYLGLVAVGGFVLISKVR